MKYRTGFIETTTKRVSHRDMHASDLSRYRATWYDFFFSPRMSKFGVWITYFTSLWCGWCLRFSHQIHCVKTTNTLSDQNNNIIDVSDVWVNFRVMWLSRIVFFAFTVNINWCTSKRNEIKAKQQELTTKIQTQQRTLVRSWFRCKMIWSAVYYVSFLIWPFQRNQQW